MKTGILLAAFGSSEPTAHRELTAFEATVREAFPALPIRWAFTSNILRHRLADEGKKTDSVRKALLRMWHEKFTHIAVQSLHVVPGKEYTDLAREVTHPGPDNEAFTRVTLGAPLLNTDQDVEKVADAIIAHLPEQRAALETVILMGHGTWHSGDSRYAPLASAVARRDPNILLATMNGARTIHHVLEEFAADPPAKVWLVPLMAVAGAHAIQDMAGDDPESWKSLLASAGISCDPVLKGVAGYPGFAEIWIEHLRRALDELA